MIRQKNNSPFSQRQLRVGELIKQSLGQIFIRDEAKVPSLDTKNITVTEVRMSPDLKNARAYVIPLGGKNADKVVDTLTEFSSSIRKALSRKVDMKFLPKVYFVEDKSFVVKVYPNPAQDELIVELNDVYEVERLEFVDFLGKIHNITTFSKNNNKLFIDISYYNSGVYTINIKTDRGLNTARIIIEK